MREEPRPRFARRRGSPFGSPLVVFEPPAGAAPPGGARTSRGGRVPRCALVEVGHCDAAQGSQLWFGKFKRPRGRSFESANANFRLKFFFYLLILSMLHSAVYEVQFECKVNIHNIANFALNLLFYTTKLYSTLSAHNARSFRTNLHTVKIDKIQCPHCYKKDSL